MRRLVVDHSFDPMIQQIFIKMECGHKVSIHTGEVETDWPPHYWECEKCEEVQDEE